MTKLTWIALLFAGIATVGLAVWAFGGPNITVINPDNRPTSVLTGLPCAHPDRRPIAIMMPSDPEARPLSGLGTADMVFEMPVTPSGITRMMAVFQCGTDPKEIGSIRSAREDFIPLAQGLKTVYAHWGGEHGALAQLDSHVIDNIDALIYEGTVFYRKPSIPRPHNGFTTLDRLRDQAQKLGYSTTMHPDGYPHESKAVPATLGSLVTTIKVSWPQDMDVEYRYNASSNSYNRWRGSRPEIDALTGRQVSASVVVVMHTDASFLRDQYITVRTVGQGSATLYQDGRSIDATWHKEKATDMLTFTDHTGSPIPLARGRIWVEIDAPLPAVK